MFLFPQAGGDRVGLRNVAYAHPAATNLAFGSASLAPLPLAGGGVRRFT